MATLTITTPEYTLYPSPRNEQRVVYEHQLFVSHPYTIIHLPDYNFRGKATLFAAHRLADGKMGQLAAFELESDVAVFDRKFVPD